MKQDTKETIGSRGTVAGFRPLIGEERWHRDDFTAEMLEGGWRPLLDGEVIVWGEAGDEYERDWAISDPDFHWQSFYTSANRTPESAEMWRTKRPLPPPQVETFEAHGYVWYRHVPGDAQPVEDSVEVEVILNHPTDDIACVDVASVWNWGIEGFGDDIIGYRFPDFPAVHTTLQQQQPSVHPSTDTQDTTKQRLATMYHGWCDVAPDSVAECITDVAKVLYPTDAERCEAEFQKWWNAGGGFFSDRFVARAAYAGRAVWTAAWNAAKQQNT